MHDCADHPATCHHRLTKGPTPAKSEAPGSSAPSRGPGAKRRAIGALLCLSAALCFSLPVDAQQGSGNPPGTATSQPDKPQSSPKKSTKKPGKAAAANKKATPPQSSQETTRERERRLQRECKGRPNAGACEGFAS